jgi:hypothetical protein
MAEVKLNDKQLVSSKTRLGPWLFLAMINYLTFPEDSSTMRKFADDITVSKVVNKSE